MRRARTHLLVQAGFPQDAVKHPQASIVGSANGETDVVQGGPVRGGGPRWQQAGRPRDGKRRIVRERSG